MIRPYDETDDDPNEPRDDDGLEDSQEFDPSLLDAVLDRLQQRRADKTSWRSAILLLTVSLLAFVAVSGWGQWVWLLTAFILLHELGHYLAMRLFGYRNVKMFFIPFLGAAASGRHYNVEGWKKSVVALAGPLPGIVIGGGLATLGLIQENAILTQAGTLALILNGLNLLPFLPCDGGWSLHAILFCRHPTLDILARAIAVLALGLLGFVFWSFWLLALFSALSAMATWPVLQAAHRLKQSGAVRPSIDDEIPAESVRTILNELDADRPPTKPVYVLAMNVESVYEILNARPPDILATLGLVSLQFASLLFAIVMIGFIAYLIGIPAAVANR